MAGRYAWSASTATSATRSGVRAAALLRVFTGVAVLGPLLQVFGVVTVSELALERVIIRVWAEILQLPGNLGVLSLLATTSHGLPPYDSSLSAPVAAQN